MSNKNDCIFCKIAKGEIKSEKVGESNNFIAIKDIRPVVEGHILIMPKAHYATLLDMPNKLGEEMLEFTKSRAFELLKSEKGSGFNILMNNLEPAGQVVKHAHIHLISRKVGDGLKMIA